MADTLELKSQRYPDSDNGRYVLLECSQTKDTSKNESTVAWKLTTIGGEVNFYDSSIKLVIDGTTEYESGRIDWDTRIFPAAKGSKSGTTIIKHGDDGKKTIEVVMTVMIYTGISRTFNKSWELDNIPRQAIITTVPEEMKSTDALPKIWYNNMAGSSVDELKICIADKKANDAYVGYRDIDKTSNNYTFTQADIDILKNLTTNSLDITFVIRTKIGGVYYYSSKPSKFIMVENDDTKPNVSALNVAINNGSLASKFKDKWIQGKSKANIEITASGKYSATIQKYITTIEGVTYDLSKFTSNILNQSGTIKIKATVKDSRGFTSAEKTNDITVEAYSRPLIVSVNQENAILCYRSDGNGQKLGNSTSVWIKAGISYYSLGGINNCTLQYRVKISSDGWNNATHLWKTLTLTNNEYNALLSGVKFEAEKSYTVQIRAIDDIGGYDVKTFDIPTQEVVLHLGKGGKNVSVGSRCDYSEEYTFHSAWKAIFDKGIVDKTNTDWVALNGFTYYRYKFGFVTVMAWCKGQMALTPNVYTNIATIPEEYKPAHDIPFTYHTQGGALFSQSAYINTRGEVLLYTPEENSDFFAFSVTYPI